MACAEMPQAESRLLLGRLLGHHQQEWNTVNLVGNSFGRCLHPAPWFFRITTLASRMNHFSPAMLGRLTVHFNLPSRNRAPRVSIHHPAQYKMRASWTTTCQRTSCALVQHEQPTVGHDQIQQWVQACTVTAIALLILNRTVKWTTQNSAYGQPVPAPNKGQTIEATTVTDVFCDTCTNTSSEGTAS